MCPGEHLLLELDSDIFKDSDSSKDGTLDRKFKVFFTKHNDFGILFEFLVSVFFFSYFVTRQRGKILAFLFVFYSAQLRRCM